jgi:hypothetical protein
MPPLALSDKSLTVLMDLAAPLPRHLRSDFLENVAMRLRREPLLGDAVVSRIGREVQQQFLRPPKLQHQAGAQSKWRR